jgi:hypothetical protein
MKSVKETLIDMLLDFIVALIAILLFLALFIYMTRPENYWAGHWDYDNIMKCIKENKPYVVEENTIVEEPQ